MDDDLDPYNVTSNSFAVENVADATTRLAENQIAKIELVRARDGALMGEITNTSGLNAGGVRVLTPFANLASDDTEEVVEVWVTLKTSVPHERIIQLRTTVWHTENAKIFGFLHNAGPDSAEFETGPAVGQGFEEAATTTLTSQEVFQGARFLAQRLRLEDDDYDPYDVPITSVMVRNMAPNSRLADTNVARLEVRRKSDGALMGEFVDPVGLSLAGVRVIILANDLVPDDSTVELEVWITLKPTIPLGRKLQLESIVWHTEGTVTFQTDPLVGPAAFTTAEGDPPTNVDFTWAPVDPSFEDEITFTPAANIGDPEGAIANATFAWDFGDGSAIEQTTGTAAVTHTYAGGGTFDVTLSVTGEDGLTSTKTNEVAVEGPPNAAPEIDEITATPANPAISEQVDFAATITDADQPEATAFDYAWSFGDADDTTSTEAEPSFTYDTAGTYTVTLTVTDEAANTATATIEVSVGNEAPTLTGLTANPVTSNTGDAVAFAAQGYADDDDDPVGEYRWDFGDGTTTTTDGANANATSHVYGAPNTYTVTVIAVDNRGAVSDPETVVVTVAGPVRVIVYGFPNPASTVATITWFLPEGATDPILRIYNLLRQLVFEQELPDGASQFAWNLRDGDVDVLSNGLYFCIVSATSAAGRTVNSEIFRLLIAR
ncbi:PKD domain-containing protein [Candidatus Bipolaricaulota bacterium]